MTDWLYKGTEFTSEMIGDNYGFVYIITNEVTGRRYIGRKYFWTVRKLPPLKGKKRKRVQRKESDWKEYYGSSDILKADIEQYGKENFRREIVSLHPNKQETNYHEMKLQFMLDVLNSYDDEGNPRYYNANINNKFYPSEKWRDHRAIVHEHYKELARKLLIE